MMKIRYITTLIIVLSFFSSLEAASKAKAKKSPDPQEILEQGREAFFNYQFDEAAELYDQYRTLKNKAKQEVDSDFEVWETQLETASNAFERVQKIIILDSIELPRKDFFKSYNLSESAGNIGLIGELVSDIEGTHPGYINETRDYAISVKDDRDGNLRLWENIHLLDGTWEERETLVGDFEKSGDYVYPFMLSDGQTLYFSNNGEESMGGYDIFVAQRDALTGEYLQPLNMGMPFNSPFDDLMMAIDEENGIGWWATDRHSEEGKITVYIFLVDEVRKNYSPDDENLVDYAMISNFKDTWQEGKEKEYGRILASLKKQKPVVKEKKQEISFDLGNGKVYTSLSDFRNRKASDLMKQYIVKEKELKKNQVNIENLRKQYRSDKSLKDVILKSEHENEILLEDVKKLRNEILRLEKSVR